MTHGPILPIAAVGLEPSAAAPMATRTTGVNFSQMLVNGVEQVNQKLVDADAMVQAFALDDTIPPHQVTFALEQARLSLELAMQVRARLVEGYQELMRMQL